MSPYPFLPSFLLFFASFPDASFFALFLCPLLPVFLSFSPPPCLLVSLGYLKLLSFTAQVALVVKNLSVSAGDIIDWGSIPGWRRSPGEGYDTPLQFSCLENPMDGGACWATVHGIAKSRTRVNDFTFTFRWDTTGSKNKGRTIRNYCLLS